MKRTCRLHCGHANDVLHEIPLHSVQTVVTSPPYFGLRNYGIDGQMGLETTIEEYVENLVTTFSFVRQVLAENGTVWLNLGDSYAGSGRAWTPGANGHPEGTKQATNKGSWIGKPPEVADMPPPKNLIGIPWRVAFALQEDGWILRSDIIWHKPNVMPSSVADRPTSSHEYLFLLAANRRYLYNSDAIKTPVKPSTLKEIEKGYNGAATKDYAGAGAQDPSAVKNRIVTKMQQLTNEGTRRMAVGANELRRQYNDHSLREKPPSLMANRRDVWKIRVRPFRGAHFAVFPEELVELCILAGSNPGDVVLDPFCGSGTVGVVAKQMDRDFIGIDIKEEYVEMARNRIGATSYQASLLDL